MSIDVDAVNERLNGLVTLLRAVGIDSGDVGALAKSVGKGGGIADGVRQLDDDQIDAIIRKLQQAQEEAPQIIAALEAHAEARSLGGGGGGGSSENRRAARNSSRAPPPPPQPTHEVESEEDEDDDDDDANYPMVGHGVSDDISVVSDLTTPTVMQGTNIPDEEHYKDTLPPMIIGGGPGHSFPMMLNPSKRKNLVSSVRPSAQTTTARRPAPSAVRPAAVSAAQLKRRPAPTPSAVRAPLDTRQETTRQSSTRPSRSSSSGGSTGSGNNPSSSRTGVVKKKVLKKKPPTAAAPPTKPVKPPPHEQSWPSDDGWNAFESGSRPKAKKSGAATVIDTDGFLVGDVNFDPFAVAETGRHSRNAAGDLEVGQQARRKAPSKTRSRSPKPERSTREETFAQLRTKTPSGSDGGRPRRSRRASLAM
jgi:hypothetical protein